jgi:hypothetical protein
MSNVTRTFNVSSCEVVSFLDCAEEWSWVMDGWMDLECLYRYFCAHITVDARIVTEFGVSSCEVLPLVRSRTRSR